MSEEHLSQLPFELLVQQSWRTFQGEYYVEGTVKSGIISVGEWITIVRDSHTPVDTTVTKICYSENVNVDNYSLKVAKPGDAIYLYLSDVDFDDLRDATIIVKQGT